MCVNVCVCGVCVWCVWCVCVVCVFCNVCFGNMYNCTYCVLVLFH